MASDIQLRARLEDALKSTAAGDLRTSTLELLSMLGYASNKTLDWPTQQEIRSIQLRAVVQGLDDRAGRQGAEREVLPGVGRLVLLGATKRNGGVLSQRPAAG